MNMSHKLLSVSDFLNAIEYIESGSQLPKKKILSILTGLVENRCMFPYPVYKEHYSFLANALFVKYSREAIDTFEKKDYSLFLKKCDLTCKQFKVSQNFIKIKRELYLQKLEKLKTRVIYNQILKFNDLNALKYKSIENFKREISVIDSNFEKAVENSISGGQICIDLLINFLESSNGENLT